MNARVRGPRSYLDVRYSSEARPYTDYPEQLAGHLTKEYLAGRRGALLDLGSGRGEFLHAFANQGFSAVGVDRCRPTEKRFAERIAIADFETDALPFEDQAFDVIFNKSVFEHTRDITHLLNECHRVLVPGGRMISLVPDWRAQWRHFFDDWTHVRPFTVVGLSECLTCHGFDVREAKRFRQLPALWKRPYLHAFADVAALLPERLKTNKIVRFSKEWMVLVVADRPETTEGSG